MVARNNNTGNLSALKISQNVADGEISKVFFNRECHILEMLDHPNIIKFYSKFETVNLDIILRINF